MVERLKDSKLLHLFEELQKMFFIEPADKEIEPYFDMENFNKALFYTVYCYSKQSKYIQLGVAWQVVKDNVARDLEILSDTLLYKQIVLMQSSLYAITVNKYLDYQGSVKLKTLVMLNDLQAQMSYAAIAQIYKSSGEVDYDQKMKNSKYAIELQEKIEEWERKVADDFPDLKEAVTEAREKKTTQKLTLSLEENLT